jgi:hypothetical protein
MSRSVRGLLTVGLLLAVAGSVRAHGAALRGASESLAVPTWLFLATGGAVVGASFLLATFATDRAFVRRSHAAASRLGSIPALARTVLAPAVGVLGLVVVLAFGFGAPTESIPDAPKENLAVLVVWVGWWAGYVMSLYLVGNTWPALDPFRTISRVLPSLDYEYPAHVGAWPAVAGLLALVFVEVAFPLAEDPVALATAVTGYGVLTVAGAVVFGVEDWFGTADPVARAFEHYGRVAPLARDDDGITLRVPGAGLVDYDGMDDAGAVAFVVALVFATTYDGFVATPAWRSAAEAVAGAGVPGLVVYLGAYALGFLAFVATYRIAARLGRRTGDTYVAVVELARRFAPPLVAIAAGYHLAHYLGFFVSLSLPLWSALLAPTAPPAPQQFVLPSFFGAVAIAAILLGHLLAVWVAHAIGFETFPGRLQAVRAQYAFVVVMIAYTMLSLWIVTQPTVTPPLFPLL